MPAALLAILTALPQILSLLVTVIKLVKNGVDAASVLKSVNDALALLATAKSQEDYNAAAKAIADSIANFPGK